MSIEQWKTRYADLLDEIPVEHHYRDEAEPKDYYNKSGKPGPLASRFDQDELGGKHGRKAFFSRTQIRREGAPRKASRTIPGWMANQQAVRDLLRVQFPQLLEHLRGRFLQEPEPGVPIDVSGPWTPTPCPCSKCLRAVRGALLWDFIIRSVRMNLPAEEIAADWNGIFEPRKRLTAALVRRTIQRIREVTAK